MADERKLVIATDDKGNRFKVTEQDAERYGYSVEGAEPVAAAAGEPAAGEPPAESKARRAPEKR